MISQEIYSIPIHCGEQLDYCDNVGNKLKSKCNLSLLLIIYSIKKNTKKTS